MATVMETIVTRRSKEYEEQIYALILSSANQSTHKQQSILSEFILGRYERKQHVRNFAGKKLSKWNFTGYETWCQLVKFIQRESKCASHQVKPVKHQK